MDISVSVPVADLPSRWGVTRSNVYSRISRLGIVPGREGGKAVITAEELEQLDRLAAHIKTGGSVAQFLNSGSIVQDRTRQDAAIAPSVDPVALAIAALAESLRGTQPLWPELEALEKAATNRWLLKSSQLKELFGLKTLPPGGKFRRSGFDFVRGDRVGVEFEWAITKRN